MLSWNTFGKHVQSKIDTHLNTGCYAIKLFT
jgi:hypothetical protein